MNKIEQSSGKDLERKLGFTAAIALVIGNTIGCGIFMIPQNLAASATPMVSFLAYGVTSLGAILIAFSLSDMACAFPRTGSCVVYVKAAFGDLPAFVVGWVFWLAQPCGVAAIITAAISYLSFAFPVLASNNLIAFITASAILWVLVLLNIRGAKEASVFQIITVILKLVPVLLFIGLAIFHFHPEFLSTSNPTLQGGPLTQLPTAIAITMWLFVGIESSTITAGEIKDPQKNIRRSTIFGTLLVVAIYLVLSFLAMGVMPQEKLASTNAPIADMINMMTGSSWGGIFISMFIVISAIGCANGITLTGARISYAIAVDNIFPKFFARVHPKFNTPHSSLLFFGVLANVLLAASYTKSLASAYMFTILLTTMGYMITYGATAAADIALLKNTGSDISIGKYLRKSALPLLAFVYILYASYGTGSESVMWGFLLIMAGIPFYIYTKIKNTGQISSTDIQEYEVTQPSCDTRKQEK